MWDRWSELGQAFFIADLPFEAAPHASATTDMLFAVDLQWDRFTAASDARRARPTSDSPSPGNLWMIELHFMFVAAVGAVKRKERLVEVVDDPEFTALFVPLDSGALRAFRNHQEHMDERLPGGKREGRALLSAPGNDMIALAEGTSAYAVNNLTNGRYLSFGDDEIDIVEVHGPSCASVAVS